jgi:hypothetical protein
MRKVDTGFPGAIKFDADCVNLSALSRSNLLESITMIYPRATFVTGKEEVRYRQRKRVRRRTRTHP